MYPLRPAVLVPTFVGAWVGADDRLPTWQHAFSDPRAKDALELMVRALRDKAAYEAPLFDENNAFLLSASVFPYFYSLVGERNPKQPPATDRGRPILRWPVTRSKSYGDADRFLKPSWVRCWAGRFRSPAWTAL